MQMRVRKYSFNLSDSNLNMYCEGLVHNKNYISFSIILNNICQKLLIPAYEINELNN
jgi:hypothetical protein